MGDFHPSAREVPLDRLSHLSHCPRRPCAPLPPRPGPTNGAVSSLSRRCEMLQLFKSRAAKLAVEKGQQVLKEFNELVPTLRALGLGLSDVSLKLGLPPEISA